ncbi:MAG: histidine kinase [Paenibacillaceae bacterium]|jgi:two-component system sensor histidine kinase VicK|nr:histidine kinase [Paenibacillaceae bacterium]
MKGIRFFQTIQTKLIIIYVLLILVAMQLIGVYFVKTLDSYFKTDFADSHNNQVTLLAEYVEPYLTAAQEGKNAENKRTYNELNDVVNKLFALSNMEIQVIDANGVVLSTSMPSHQAIVGQKNTQKEVSRALQGIKDNERIFTDIDGIRKMVIAKPIGSGAKIVGAVYIVASMEELYNTMNRINRIFISGTLIALAMTAFLGVILSHTITNPIKEITRQVTLVAEGQFSEQVVVKGHDEIGKLGQTFNFMINRLKEALTLNEEEREKLASILINMNDGLIATDNQWTVILMNRKAYQMLQLDEQQIQGKTLADILGIEEEMIAQYVLGEHNATNIQRYHSDADEQLSLRISFSPIHRRGHGVTGTIAVLQDVTEQEKLEISRREFVANVSHELRTPLTTIKSYLEALDDGAMEDPQLAGRFIGVTRNETERMIRLVNDLLHLSRLDSRQAVLVKERVNVTDLLENVSDRFSFQLLQRRIHIELTVGIDVPDIHVDRDQMDQVLDNLVSNAVKYTPEGGKIRIGARVLPNKQLEVSIRDNGIGIPKKDLTRIFERFYRVDKARSRNMGGTGLGLSIAREIIRAHGGTIRLDSEFNEGTTVTFTLPTKPTGGSEA